MPTAPSSKCFFPTLVSMCSCGHDAAVKCIFNASLVSDPPPKRKGGSGKYNTSSPYGLAVAMDSAKSQAFDVSCWASVNWRSVKV